MRNTFVSRIFIYVLLISICLARLCAVSITSKFIGLDLQQRIVAAKSVFNGASQDIAITRYFPDGTLDTTFNALSLTPGLVTTNTGGFDDGGNSLVIDDNNRIVVAGFSNNGVNDNFVVLRYLETGAQDIFFGTLGVTVTNFGNKAQAQALLLDDNQRLIAVGFNSADGVLNNFAIARYTPNGFLDPQFNVTGPLPGTNSTAFTDSGGGTGSAQGQAATIDAQGRIVVAGFLTQVNTISSTTTSDTQNNIALARYLPNGVLDESFNALGDLPGRVITRIANMQARAFSVIIDDNQRILVAGIAQDNLLTYLLLVRYNPDGTIDGTFNSGEGQPGVSLRALPGLLLTDAIRDSVIIDQNNTIIVSAYVQRELTDGIESQQHVNAFIIAAYNMDGVLQSDISAIGLIDPVTPDDLAATIPIDISSSVLLDDQQRIVASGFSNDTIVSNSLALARYNPDLSLDTSFNSAGLQPGTVFVNLFRGSGETLGAGGSDVITEQEEQLLDRFIAQGQQQRLAQITEQSPLTIISPTGGAYARTAHIRFSGTAARGQTLVLFLNGQPLARTLSTNQNTWHLVLPPLTDGTYTATISIVDALDNPILSSATVSFTVDTRAPPLPSITSPKAQSLVTSSRVLFTGTAQPGVLVQLLLDGIVSQETLANAQGRWSATIDPLFDATYQLSVRAIDKAGNSSALTPPMRFMVDTRPVGAPVITTPRSGAISSGTLTIAGNAKPNAIVTISIDNKSIGTATANKQGAWNITAKNIALGDHILSATARDVTGASAVSQLVPFSIRTAQESTRRRSRGATEMRTISFTGNAKPYAKVSLLIDGIMVDTDEVQETGRWEFVYAIPSGMRAGRHTASVIIADSNGNQSSVVRRPFTVESN